jgi:hypothetical protein
MIGIGIPSNHSRIGISISSPKVFHCASRTILRGIGIKRTKVVLDP